MELTPSTSFWANVNRTLFDRDTYKTDTGCKFTMKQGTGCVDVAEDGTITVSDADTLKIYGSKSDDKIKVLNSYVKAATIGRGKDAIMFDNCEFKKHQLFHPGTVISTYGKKDDVATIMINGDFDGYMNLQQGMGKGWGKDDYAHKDHVLITGNNNGSIQVDGCDKVAIKGKEKGRISNVTVYYV